MKAESLLAEIRGGGDFEKYREARDDGPPDEGNRRRSRVAASR